MEKYTLLGDILFVKIIGERAQDNLNAIIILWVKIMGNVLIIKNNGKDERIGNYARESLEKRETKYYNSLDGTINEESIIRIKKKLQSNASDVIVLMINYGDLEFKQIKDMYIGNHGKINEKNSIEYVMKIHLTKENNQRTIDSIIDKIDLDADADFGKKCYVIMNDMESLYQELLERIYAIEDTVEEKKNIFSKRLSENYQLNALAQKDEQSVRVYINKDGGFRTEFQRDRERVVNCKAFRRMVDKAQIFGAEKGDYYRTRMTHTLEVNQIAKAISFALNLNLDLTEAIALGHDLGHTPFGHQGERTLDEILSGKIKVGIVATDSMFEHRVFGGFKHNYQSAKILTEIEEKYKEFPGLNVSVQVVEGVLKHTKLKPDQISIEDFLPKDYLKIMGIDKSETQVCSNLEGQVVAIADEIAQRGHDVDDALTSGVMSINEFMDRLKIDKCKELYSVIDKELNEIEGSKRLIIDKKELCISRIVSAIINYFVQKTIEYSKVLVKENQVSGQITMENSVKMIDFPSEVQRVNNYLEKVVQKKVICNNEVARVDHNADMVVQKLFAKYYGNPRLLHAGTVHKIFLETLQHENREVSNSAVLLSDGSIKLVNEEIEEMTLKELDGNKILTYLKGKTQYADDADIIIFEKRRILIRAITDFIAGMTDGYAMNEYEKLQ